MMKRILLSVGLVAALLVGQSASADLIEPTSTGVTVSEEQNGSTINYTVTVSGLGDLSLVAFVIDFQYFGNNVDEDITIITDGGFVGEIFDAEDLALDQYDGYVVEDFEGDDLGEGNYVVVFTDPDNNDGGGDEEPIVYEFGLESDEIDEVSTPRAVCTGGAACAATDVPAPASMGLMGLGFAGFLLTRRKFKKA